MSTFALNFFQNELKTNEKAHVTFRFKHRPEYVRLSARMLFREGATRGMGEVCSITPWVPRLFEPCTTSKHDKSPVSSPQSKNRPIKSENDKSSDVNDDSAKTSDSPIR